MPIPSRRSADLSGPAWDLDTLFVHDEDAQRLARLTESRSTGHAFAVLHGDTGSGKSALVRDQPWDEMGWVLTSGKFEDHTMSEPFSAVVQALTAAVQAWIDRNRLAEVCQMAGFRSLLDEDIDFLFHIMPKAVTAAATAKCESASNSCSAGPFRRHRTFKPDQVCAEYMNASIVRILRFMCEKMPLVLFIDNIHWADQPSLNWIQYLASGVSCAVPNLLLVVAYRDDEIDEQHTVLEMLRTVEKLEVDTKVPMEDIQIQNLDVQHINRLVAPLLRQEPSAALELSKVIHKKTAGNPLFVSQFIIMLRQEHFLTYNFATLRWEWGDIESLDKTANVCDNVADIVANSIRRLPQASRVAVTVASALGHIVPLNVLLQYFGSFVDDSQSTPVICPNVMLIQMEGLQNLLDDAVVRGILVKPPGQDTYTWAHDKLRHVAYSLIPEEYQLYLHMNLGKRLWKMSQEEPEESWMLFLAAEQFNRYSHIKQGEALGDEVATLCLQAARLSLSKSALVPSFDMLMAAVKHLDMDNKWTDHYDLSLDLSSTVAEVALQLGKLQQAEKAVQEVENNARVFEDKFRVQCVKLRMLTAGVDRNYEKGIKITMEILSGYGMKLPKSLLPGQLYIELQLFQRKIPIEKMDSLLESPEMTDVTSLRIVTLISEFLCPFYGFSKGTGVMMCSASLRVLNLSIKKGVCQGTASALASVGAYLTSTGKLDDANVFGEVALKLINQFPKSVGSIHALVTGVVAGGIYSTTKPLNRCMEMILECHHVAMKNGATERAIGYIVGYAFTYSAVGLPLGPLRSDIVQYSREASQFHMPETIGALFQIVEQTIINLEDLGNSPTLLKGEALDEGTILQKFAGNGLQMTKRDLETFRLLLANVYGDLEACKKSLDVLDTNKHDIFVARSYFRQTLMALAAFRLARSTGKQNYRSLGKKIKKRFEADVKRGNVNAHAIYLMLVAEASPSKENYDVAIRACARLGLLHYEAYLCERTADLFLEQGDSNWAEFYMAQAYVLYDDWGAKGKLSQMEVLYPHLLKSASMRESVSSALKGRSRYDSTHSDVLKELDLQDLRSDTSSALARRSTKTTVTRSDSSTDISSDDNSDHVGDEMFTVTGIMK
eukprot:Nitzschia sp. Nitz4//scaffold219_size35776//22461//25811//NITZ4_007825-RA/size35776-processed-gene-0.12-mRNA-1//-1//CDS//3329542323//5467//frame0